MNDPGTSTALRQLADLGDERGPSRWSWATARYEPGGRVRLPAAARAAVGCSPGQRLAVRGVCNSATKAAVNQVVRSAARELAPHGIRVNAISPGITETPMTAVNPEIFSEAAKGIPLGRAGQPEDFGPPAMLLCGPSGAFYRREHSRRRRRVAGVDHHELERVAGALTLGPQAATRR